MEKSSAQFVLILLYGAAATAAEWQKKRSDAVIKFSLIAKKLPGVHAIFCKRIIFANAFTAELFRY